MDVFNLHGDEWDRTEDREGWRSKDAWIGHRLGAELLGGSLYELAPGDRLFPYHVHHANEEWIVVVRGEPTLRTLDGEQLLRAGDVAVFRRGAEGAHQVANRTDAPVRVLMLSSLVMPEIVEYLDSGKVGHATRAGSASSSRGRRARGLLGRRGLMLDDRVRQVLARMEAEDDAERVAGLPPSERSLAVGPDSGRLLFALVAPNAGCEVLEIGGSRGYSTIWLAAAARILGGRVVSLEQDDRKIAAWRANIADAGLEEWAELVEGDAGETLPDARGRLRRRLPRRLEGRLRGVLRDRPDEARAGRRRGRRQRRLDSDGAGVRRAPAGGPERRLGHHPDRERPRGHDRPPLTESERWRHARGDRVHDRTARLGHVTTADVAAASGFYGELFGWTAQTDPAGGGRVHGLHGRRQGGRRRLAATGRAGGRPVGTGPSTSRATASTRRRRGCRRRAASCTWSPSTSSTPAG